MIVSSFGDVMADLYAGVPRATLKVLYPAPPPKPSAPKEEAGEEEKGGGGFWNRFWEGIKGVARTVAGLASAVGRAIGRAISAVAKTLYHLAAAYVELAQIYAKVFMADLNYKVEQIRDILEDTNIPLWLRYYASFGVALVGFANTAWSIVFSGNFNNEQKWAAHCRKIADRLYKEVGNDWKYWEVTRQNIPPGLHAWLSISPKNKIHKLIDPGYNVDPWALPGIAPIYPKINSPIMEPIFNKY